MKKTFLFLGIIFLLLAWLALPFMGNFSFSKHMTMHMLVVALGAPCMALYIAEFNKKFPDLFYSSIPAAMMEFLVVWFWHLPKPHHWARSDLFGLLLEQGSFLSAGMWVWFSSFAGDKGTGIISLLLTSMHMTLLGAILSLSLRPLYTHHIHGGDPLADQQLGGGIMLVIGGASYLAGGLALTHQLLKKKLGLGP